MVRDKIKDADYFSKLIAQNNERILKFNDKLLKNEVVHDRISIIKEKVFSIKLDLVISRYSKGDNINDISKDFSNLLAHEINLGNHHDNYVEYLWLISLAILLKTETPLVKKLIAINKQNQLNDRLIDFLIKYLEPEWQGNSQIFLHNKPYKAFSEIFSANKNEASVRLKKYLEKEWYKGHADSGWRDTHKSTEMIYSGYWSFESAAIVKIVGIDDSNFRNNQFYPCDLLHW